MSDAPRAGHEAARLLAAAQEWLRTSAPDLAPVTPLGETCACPLCRAVVSVREADPESVGRWVDSAIAAATVTLAQVGEHLSSDPADDPDVPADEPGYAEDADDVASDDQGTPAPAASDDVTPEQASGRARGVRRIPLVAEGGEPDR